MARDWKPQLERKLQHLLDEAGQIIRHNDEMLAPLLQSRRQANNPARRLTFTELIRESRRLCAQSRRLRRECLQVRADAMEARAIAQAARCTHEDTPTANLAPGS